MEPMGKTPAIASKLNTLLRMGLVSKNNVRRAMVLFADPEKAMKNPAYRLLMQEILVDVVDRVLNNKTLYTALRSSLAKEPTTVIEGVEKEREKTLLRSGLEKNKPTKPELWAQAKSKARAKFDVYPSAYANGWAVKWYNEQGGGWKSVSEGKTFSVFSKEIAEGSTQMNNKTVQQNAEMRKKARELRYKLESEQGQKKDKKETT
jgi:hypothetical protein